MWLAVLIHYRPLLNRKGSFGKNNLESVACLDRPTIFPGRWTNIWRQQLFIRSRTDTASRIVGLYQRKKCYAQMFLLSVYTFLLSKTPPRRYHLGIAVQAGPMPTWNLSLVCYEPLALRIIPKQQKHWTVPGGSKTNAWLLTKPGLSIWIIGWSLNLKELPAATR